MSDFEETSIWESETDPANTKYMSPSTFGNVGEIAYRASEPNKLFGLSKVAYGYGMVSLGALMVFLEQSPANENWRIQKGFETLVNTGNPKAVERTVQLVTLPIETVPALIIGLVVHSSNPVIEKARDKFHSWMDGGELRIEHRDADKADKRNAKEIEKNEKRIAKGKQPKMTTLEKAAEKEGKEATKNYWKSLVNADKADKRNAKEIEKNEKRIAKGKQPKMTTLEKAAEKEGKEGFITKTGRIVKDELTDALLALGLGAGIVIFKEAMTKRDTSIPRTIWTGLKSILTISFVSGKIGYFVAAGTSSAKLNVPLTDKTIHYEQQAQWLIDYGTDTKAIMTVLIAAYGPGWAKKLWHRMPKREARFQEWLATQHQAQDKLQTQPISA